MDDTATWDCVTRSENLNDWAADVRLAIAHAAQDRQWDTLLELVLSSGKGWVNAVHLNEPAFDTPLHEAARGGAPESVVQRILDLMAFRTMRNTQGQRPIDIARATGHTHLYSLLEPRLRSDMSFADLQPIQHHFHALIHQRARHLERAEYHSLRLPELEPLLETNISDIWCSIPGMYGGFDYWLAEGRDTPTLVTVSWIRVVGGSGQRHEIDGQGIRLVEAHLPGT
ncbi:MAG: ankyrin repeat domain-containing protein [Anaerolineae bacterium]|nr:ankyrin repeat domain-containing protein [Anaerolineae bacterium]